MKILKLLLVFTLVSTIAVSCNETKKEEVQDDAAVEMTEESSDAGSEEAPAASTEASDEEGSSNAATGAAVGAAAASSASDSEGSKEAVESIDAESKEIEAVIVPEGVIAEELADTPVVYPGCTGSVEEIRACNKESFIAYLKSEFNHEAAKGAGLKRGDYEIGTVIHINKAGRVFSLRVTAANKALENEMIRVVNSTPAVVPATVAGEPVGVSIKFLVDFRVEQTQ